MLNTVFHLIVRHLEISPKRKPFFQVLLASLYSKLLPYRHLTIMDTLIIWTAAKSQANIN